MEEGLMGRDDSDSDESKVERVPQVCGADAVWITACKTTILHHDSRANTCTAPQHFVLVFTHRID